MKIEKILENFGLNSKQAVVYKACLELGNGSGQQIANKSGLPKSTVYDTLKELSAKSLVNIYLKNKKRHFSASTPQIFREKIKNQTALIEEFLPQLEAIYNTKEYKPKVRFYEGKDGLHLVIKEILKEAKELISFASAEDAFSKLSSFFPNFSKERAKKKIPLRIILRDSPKARERKESGSEELREVKIVQTKILFNSLIWIWQNKIALITLKEDFMLIIIESKELSDTLKAMFELIWTVNN